MKLNFYQTLQTTLSTIRLTYKDIDSVAPKDVDDELCLKVFKLILGDYTSEETFATYFDRLVLCELKAMNEKKEEVKE